MKLHPDYYVAGSNAFGQLLYKSWNIGSSVIDELGAWAIRAEREDIVVTLTDVKKATTTTYNKQELLDKQYLKYDWPTTVIARSK